MSIIVSLLLIGCVAFTENVPPAGSDTSGDSKSALAPTISSISPNKGTTDGGTVVTISGTNFQPGASVNFGTTSAASVSFVSTSQLRATTRSSPAGIVPVEVINPDGQKARHNGFTFERPPVPAPSITSISPTSGPTTGGTVVTIQGANFQSGARVFFGNVAAASVSFVSSSQLRATSPPHPAGSVPIQVTNPDGQSGQLNTFTYVEPAPAAPQVSGISPTSGPTAGGTDVTINGANFQSGATVTFDGIAAATNFVSSSQLVARTPPHAAGAVTLVVRNPDGQFARTTFSYVETTSSDSCPQQNLACETFDGAQFTPQWDWNITPYVKPNVGVDGSKALEVEIPQDSPDTIFPRIFFSDQGINWVHARFYLRTSANYVFYPNNGAGAQKLAYLEANAATGGSSYWRVMLRLQRRDDQGDDLGYLSVDFNTHTEFINCPVPAQCRIERDRWYAIEFAVLPNQRKGVANGAIKVWVNGLQVIDASGLDFKKIPTNDQDGVGLSSFWVSAYYGGPTMPHPTMWLWYDHIAVARGYIGPIR
ncbi:MAG: IPT/TIG domain-containing protein [Firmicutes bacterium]|nr:IPT/TIG domain-containing protein [Bacillota bacterium]